MTALVHIGQEEESFWKREISADFENGGGLQIIVRGESIAGVLEILFGLVAVVVLDRDRTIDLKLRYWHLTEELESVEVTAHAWMCEDYATEQSRLVRRLAADAKSSFVNQLARHHIALRGEKGEL